MKTVNLCNKTKLFNALIHRLYYMWLYFPSVVTSQWANGVCRSLSPKEIGNGGGIPETGKCGEDTRVVGLNR